MRYEILGPLRVVGDDGGRFINSQKIETLLSTLLVREGQLVPTDQLIVEIWGQDPPAKVIASIHVYISQLRKYLCGAGAVRSPIVTRPSGYLLRAGADELDVRSFHHLARIGRAHVKEQRFEQAAESLSAALALWRGPVLGDVRGGPIIRGYVTWLTEARAECIELLIEAQLGMGMHRELVGWLYSLTVEYPLREVFYQQLMLALYRCGRQADALKAYQTVRSMLRDELGLEPCRELQRIQHAILTADVCLDELTAVH